MHPHEVSDFLFWGKRFLSMVKRIHHNRTRVSLSHFTSGSSEGSRNSGGSAWSRGGDETRGDGLASYTTELRRSGPVPRLAGTSRPPGGCRSTRSTGGKLAVQMLRWSESNMVTSRSHYSNLIRTSILWGCAGHVSKVSESPRWEKPSH